MIIDFISELVRDGQKITPSSVGRKDSVYFIFNSEDLQLLKEKGVDSLEGKFQEIVGIFIENEETKSIEFSTFNEDLAYLFDRFENKTILRDLNKSWNKQYFYRTIFPIFDFRMKPTKQVDKIQKALEEQGLLGKFNSLYDIVDSREKVFVKALKRELGEEEVFEKFNISFVHYLSEKRKSYLRLLDSFYFDELFMESVKNLMVYCKKKYKKENVVIYFDFADDEWTNEEIYNYEHSLFVMLSGFLKSDKLQVIEESGEKTIYGYLPLASTNNKEKRTHKNYGRNEQPNAVVTAAEMLEMYETSFFENAYLAGDYVFPKVKGLEKQIRVKVVNSKKSDTLLIENIIREDVSNYLPEPVLLFDHYGNRTFQDKWDLFKEIRDCLFNHPRGMDNNFYRYLLDAENIKEIKVEADKFTGRLKSDLVNTHLSFKGFFDGNIFALKPLFPQKINDIFKERVLGTNKVGEESKYKKRDIKDMINLILYLKQFTFGNSDEVLKMEKAREKLVQIAEGEELGLTKNEFLYAVGVLSQYYARKSKSKKNNWGNRYDGLLRSNNTTKLFREMNRLLKEYSHGIYVEYDKHNYILRSVIQAFEKYRDEKIEDLFYITFGLVDKNILFKKKQQDDEEENVGGEEDEEK